MSNTYPAGQQTQNIPAASNQPEHCLDCHAQLGYSAQLAGHVLCESCISAANERAEKERKGILIAIANRRAGL